MEYIFILAGVLIVLFRKSLVKSYLSTYGLESNKKWIIYNEVVVLVVGLGWTLISLSAILGIVKFK